MARVASTSSAVGLPRFRPSSFQSHHQTPRFGNFSFHFQKKNHGLHRIICRNNPNPVESAAAEEKPLAEPDSEVNGTAAAETTSSTGAGFPEYPDKSFNRRLAVVSTLGAVGLFLSARLDFGGVSLKDLSAAALPYEEALSNGKPTVVEFYADWCEVCRELAPDVYKVEQQYKEGNEEGNVVGRLPRQYLLKTLMPLLGEATVPHARVVGQYSSASDRKVRPVVDPRSHG
ncbi:hypothetical protein DH2020_037589 [Rehmannia glutinosa]|uniref:Thioredoxin domain-containing protein n=1 Tax=Rehmannia glutinosa TaxID=99300 RepID=A0ABR0V285_REHGL